MKIIFHGAAREVGKSCIEIQTEGQRYIMDAGIKFIPHGTEYPKYLDKIYELDGIFISHAHLDHSGALPMLEHKNLNCPIYMTNMTWKITNLLLQDSYHLEKLKRMHPCYVERDIRKVKKDLEFVKYDKQYETKDKKIKFQYINSGHIPGGASILMEIEGKKLLYTADINTENTNLMIPSEIENLVDPIDILITENTYGDRMHPDKKDSEEGLLDSINECIKAGGSALVPVFGVGRSQEILIILSKLDSSIPIYLDGMARKLTDLMIRLDDKYIDNREKLEQMYNRCIIVQQGKEREFIAKKKGIVIVSTSGMVQGGPAVTYTEKMIGNKDNYILLTGYQAKGTSGRSLFEDHLFYHHHHREKVKAHVRKFDFSAHYGQDSIHNLITKLKPKTLILQHGDLEALEAVRNFAVENLKETTVLLPFIGEEMEFK
ncbi:MAG: MBL fold metallo-hydrolase [Nanoarchaeota archaeon]|nr:MBL fold metallo-hydrolase [Nanoarchaeota archaeon]